MDRFHHTPQDQLDQIKAAFSRLLDYENFDEATNNRLYIFISGAVILTQVLLVALLIGSAGLWGIILGPVLAALCVWFDVNFLLSPLIRLLDALRAQMDRQKKPSRSSAYRKAFLRTWRRLHDTQKIKTQQGTAIRSYLDKIKMMKVDIDDLREEKEDALNEVQNLIKELRKEEKRTAEQRLLMENVGKELQSEKGKMLDAERRRALAVRDGKSKLEQSQRGILSDVPMERFVHFFTEQCAEGKISDVATDDIGALYAVMHKHVPDMERVKEMSLIPNEILRAQQTQTLNNYYSDLIKGVENDETLSSEEKDDKISIYRMSREQEFGTYS